MTRGEGALLIPEAVRAAGGADAKWRWRVGYRAGEDARMSWRGPDRRRSGHDRLPVHLPVTALELEAGGGPWAGRLENLSAGGARIRLPAAPPPGARLAVTLHVRKRHRLSTAATVRWTHPVRNRRAWRVGIAFLQELPGGALEEMRRRDPHAGAR